MHIFVNITWSHDRWVTWVNGCGQLNLNHILLKLVAIVLVKMEIKFLFNIGWSHGRWATWLDGLDTPTLNCKGCIVRATKLYKNIYMYYKSGQACVTNWSSFVLLEIRGNIVTNWDSFIITNWGNCCYKLGQLLQIRATVITK